MMRAWLCDSLERVYPWSRPRGARLRLDVARGEKFSFQVAVILDRNSFLEACVTAPPGIRATIRRIGFVPLPYRSFQTPPAEIEGYAALPGYVPDPLLEDVKCAIPPTSTNAYWISCEADPDCRPGLARIRVTLLPEACHGPSQNLVAEVQVYPVRLKPRRDFDVTHWFYADALCDWYKVEPWSEDFWRIVKPYLRNLVAHGQNVLYVPVFTPPLDGVKRPTQLLKVRRTGKNRYHLDWTDVARWIATAKACGIEKFEWCHLFTQWGAEHAIRIYEKKAGCDTLLWPPDTRATSPTYRAFLAQYLPQLQQFLLRQKILDRSFFHLSDEPHGEVPLINYRRARSLLRELAPWMKVMDALSDIRFAHEKLVDLPIPSIQTARQFHEEQIPCWSYFCCGPLGKYLNRLLETPLAKMRMAGWLFYRFGDRGFLHWGYNYWYKRQTQQLINPFFQLDGEGWPGWVSGDPFVVYPGPNGPVDSIRWEVFGESLQDYQLLQTVGVPPASLAREFIDYNQFPKSAAWLRRTRRALLQRGN